MYAAFSYLCIRPSATHVCGLNLLLYAALRSPDCQSLKQLVYAALTPPEATSVCGLTEDLIAKACEVEVILHEVLSDFREKLVPLQRRRGGKWGGIQRGGGAWRLSKKHRTTCD